MEPFIFTPFPILETDRLVLRQMEMTDEHEIFILRSDERVLKYIDIPKALTVNDARKFIERINEGAMNNEAIMWAISLKNNRTLIGTICYWNIEKEFFTADIGYMLHPDFQGKGIMQEALTKVIEYGLYTMNLKRIDAEVDPNNSPSIKLLEKNGFAIKSQAENTVIYSRPKDFPSI